MRHLKNHYRTLGVPTQATQEEIKSAYRRMARLHHPDSGHEGNEELFKTIAEAYNVIGDEYKRKRYDEALYLHGILKRTHQSVLFDAHWIVGQLAELNKHIAQTIGHELYEDLIVAYIKHLFQEENRLLLQNSPEAQSGANEELLKTAKSLHYPDFIRLLQWLNTHLHFIILKENEQWCALRKLKYQQWRWQKFKPYLTFLVALIISVIIAFLATRSKSSF